MLTITSEPLSSKTHPTPITFFGDVRLLGTELEVAVKRIQVKSNLQRVVDSVHRSLEGVQHENVAKPLVVEKSTEFGKKEVRVATPLAVASLEELLDQVETNPSTDAPTDAAESVLMDLGIEWDLETKKDIAVQLLRGVAHLQSKFAGKADGAYRYIVNLKPSNVLLFSRGSQGGVSVKLSDFFSHVVRTKEELATVLEEKFGEVPDSKEWKDDALSVDQWSIIDAESFVVGLILKRIFGSDDEKLQRLVASMTHSEASRRLSASAAANHPSFWSPAKKGTFLSQFLASLDFRRKGLKDAVRNARVFADEDHSSVSSSSSSSSSWADERHGIDRRLLEELRKKRKGGYEEDSLLGLAEFMMDVGKQLARPTRVLAPLMEELFPSSSSCSSSDSHTNYFLDKFPYLPETCLPICADLPIMKGYVGEEVERFEIPTRELAEEEEEDEVEEVASSSASQEEVPPPPQSFSNFRHTSRQSHSDEDDQRCESASPTKSDGDDRTVEPSASEYSVADAAVSQPPSTSPSQIDADIDALTTMWSQGAGDIASTTTAKTATSAKIDDLSDLLAGFGVAAKQPERVTSERKTEDSATSAPSIFSARPQFETASPKMVKDGDSADRPGAEEALDLTSLANALEETEKQKTTNQAEKSRKTTLAIILTAKEQLESEEVDDALEALRDVGMTYELLLETKIGLALRAAKKRAQDEETKKGCSDLISKWKALLLDQVDKENEENKKQCPPKKKSSFQFLAETATTDDLRLKSRKMILDALVERREDAPSTKIAKNIAARVEETIFQSTKGDTGQKYRSAIRSRVFNLRDAKNPELGDEVVDGGIRPEAFALMSAEEMASKDMKRLREQLQQEANRTERVLSSPRNLFLTRW